ncbi:MAG: hypothetical protein LBF50_06675 [Azoarcus sp.]|jgi:hypothetical protein|nr:hypothetical protein [Azoarcus sp.]
MEKRKSSFISPAHLGQLHAVIEAGCLAAKAGNGDLCKALMSGTDQNGLSLLGQYLDARAEWEKKLRSEYPEVDALFAAERGES